jgi:hypothetical protein
MTGSAFVVWYFDPSQDKFPSGFEAMHIITKSNPDIHKKIFL